MSRWDIHVGQADHVAVIQAALGLDLSLFSVNTLISSVKNVPLCPYNAIREWLLRALVLGCPRDSVLTAFWSWGGVLTA